jgi:inner membrane protein
VVRRAGDRRSSGGRAGDADERQRVRQHVPLVTHRGPTHTLWFAVLVGAAFAGLAWVVTGAVAPGSDAPGTRATLVALAFAFGVLVIVSHVLADALTPMGVEPFAPVSEVWYSADLVRADNSVANYVLFGLGVVATVGAYVAASAVVSGSP